MPNPWDILPPSDRGDDDPNAIFLEVGRALTQWEQLEEQLALLFAALTGGEQPEPAMRAYGTIATNRGRLDMLQSATEAFLRTNQVNDEQNAIGKLIRNCQNFGARRNEIAHGLTRKTHLRLDVKNIDLVLESDNHNTWYLEPPMYNSNKNPASLGIDTSKFPPGINPKDAMIKLFNDLAKKGPGKYRYTAEQIKVYSEEFSKLRQSAADVVASLQSIKIQLQAEKGLPQAPV